MIPIKWLLRFLLDDAVVERVPSGGWPLMRNCPIVVACYLSKSFEPFYVVLPHTKD